MKTTEELNALKEEVETVSRKLSELTKEELAQVTGGKKGYFYGNCPICDKYVRIFTCAGICYGDCGHEWK